MAKKAKTDNSAFQRLKTALKTGLLERCYILYGEEDYIRTLYLKRMQETVLDGPAASFNLHRFDRESLDWETVAAAVETLPMMAERSMVVVTDIDLYKEPEGAREKIINILSDLPSHCCLVFHYDTVTFSPDRRMKKLHSAIEGAAELVEFQKQPASDLRVWIRKQAKAGGKDIDVETSDYLVFLTDGSLSTMEGEIKKLCAYAREEVITRQDVDDLVEPALTAVSFDISNAIVDGNYDRALLKLRELFAMQQEPIVLLGAVAGQMRRLQCARVLSDHGRGNGELMKLCGIGEYAARLTMNAARRLPAGFCGKAVLLCLETDRRLKSSYDDPERLLELLLIQLAREARA